jgi:hypothetical protein
MYLVFTCFDYRRDFLMARFGYMVAVLIGFAALIDTQFDGPARGPQLLSDGDSEWED